MTYKKIRSEIDDVYVNGMRMYRYGHSIFLTVEDAMEYIRNNSKTCRKEANYNALGFGREGVDPFEEILLKGNVKGIKL